MAPKAPPPQARFKMITETCPEFLPLTAKDRRVLGAALRIPESKHNRIIKRPYLCLPQSELCILHMRWFENHAGRPPVVGTMMVTIREWIDTFGERAYHELMAELQDRGRPTVHWQYLACLDPEDEEGDPGDGRNFD